MSLEHKVLSRLEKVRKKGKDKWLACCPAHNDRDPSLAIAFGEEGRLLLHCHAGCSATDVFSAIGLTWDDLFPEGKLQRHRASLLRFVAPKRSQGNEDRRMDALIVEMGSATVSKGKRLSQSDKATLKASLLREYRSKRVV